ncbi:VOC family protein [Sphingomonas sp. MAH-20]|uniref:VOC family protein n=1 Tax=Sphingomonas horti TaxID=2682842 RepID=A0A6I4J7L0_9SPHN|nr:MULTISPECIES: VOC family protein [Sphingomonas]MBA2918828.1 VOC family protein [Sphingomonas sp. CGMCC 1.13658]MVO78861.1 VOC family protein [Sphingomonas horti]
MSKITPTLWFNGGVEEAAEFYVSLLPESRVESINRSPIDTPSGPEGQVLTAIITLAGQRFCLLNGGPIFPQTEAVSFMIETDSQEETDRLWNAIVNNGGKESACGWCKDKWGVSWQVTPRRLLELTTDKDTERAKRAMASMMTMRKIDIAAIERAAAGEGVDA